MDYVEYKEYRQTALARVLAQRPELTPATAAVNVDRAAAGAFVDGLRSHGYPDEAAQVEALFDRLAADDPGLLEGAVAFVWWFNRLPAHERERLTEALTALATTMRDRPNG